MTNEIPPDIRSMIDRPGLYLCGDRKAPEATIPIVSMNGKLYSMEVDQELAPDRFLGTRTIAGPFRRNSVLADTKSNRRKE